jgi:hypothetical protein
VLLYAEYGALYVDAMKMKADFDMCIFAPAKVMH